MSGGWPYNTARWRKLRASKLRANPMCEYCPPHAQAIATEVDHKQAINNGGDPWDWANLASACGACHKSKTVADKQGRTWVRRGCGPDGMPIDPGHPCYAFGVPKNVTKCRQRQNSDEKSTISGKIDDISLKMGMGGRKSRASRLRTDVAQSRAVSF